MWIGIIENIINECQTLRKEPLHKNKIFDILQRELWMIPQ